MVGASGESVVLAAFEAEGSIECKGEVGANDGDGRGGGDGALLCGEELPVGWGGSGGGELVKGDVEARWGGKGALCGELEF